MSIEKQGATGGTAHPACSRIPEGMPVTAVPCRSGAGRDSRMIQPPPRLAANCRRQLHHGLSARALVVQPTCRDVPKGCPACCAHTRAGQTASPMPAIGGHWQRQGCRGFGSSRSRLPTGSVLRLCLRRGESQLCGNRLRICSSGGCRSLMIALASDHDWLLRPFDHWHHPPGNPIKGRKAHFLQREEMQ